MKRKLDVSHLTPLTSSDEEEDDVFDLVRAAFSLVLVLVPLNAQRKSLNVTLCPVNTGINTREF